MAEGDGIRKQPIDWEDWQGLHEGTKWNAYQESQKEVVRLRNALREAAKMTDFEVDRTLIHNHCMDAVEAKPVPGSVE